MEHYGLWGLLPPLLTIILALLTKDVIVSLFAGIFSGTMVLAGGNPFLALTMLTDTLANSLADGWNIRIFLFCGMLGALVGMLGKTGSAWAFGKWASKGIKTKTGALLFTWFFGLIIFIDDYFNSLTIGTVMRPLSDRTKTSRAKLAYVLDSTAAPVCILAPISSWVVTVIGQIKGSAGFEKLGVNEFTYFLKVIPFNLYAIFAILMVIVITLTHRDFGPMAESEERAEKGKGLFDEDRFGAVAGKVTERAEKSHANAFDMLFPIGLLIVMAISFFPITTWLGKIDGKTITTFGEAMQAVSLTQAFNDTDASKALFYAIIFTITVTYAYYFIRKLLDLKSSADSIIEGIKSMVPALIILTMAWSIGSIIKETPAKGGLGLSKYLSDLVVSGGFPLWLLPILVFLLACIISFSTGTSWGTFLIMIPIIMPISIGLAEAQGLVGDALLAATLAPIGAILGGAIFGDHSSPISDTTILSSTGASCPHLEHVATQVPYAIFVATAAMAGHLVGGVTLNPYLALATTAVLFVIGVYLLPKIWQAKRAR